ncbi:Gp37 family protein [Lelliottia wanjuensis]|uniref:Gp37 family protein n=1 Tax=Lelliottia wanjuensis TaxID=3050585 RepID=UPI00254A338E|nr:Gp37 family protein [Lelliottia sp. V104_15]MDK9603491.1 Gp37 family protein [Lelliottia sp. V104_15]
MDTSTIVNDVVERLRTRLPEAFQVEYCPGKPEASLPVSQAGAVMVSYIRSKYHKPNDASSVVQPQTVRLRATIIMRKLNGFDGAGAVLEQVRRALGGWRPVNCHRPIRLRKDTFIGEVEGLWQYALEFVVETMFVEDSEADELPVLSNINYEEQL